MGLINRLYNFLSGQTIYASQVNAELNQILALLNGNIENTNVKTAAAIDISKIANLSVEHNANGTHSTINTTWLQTVGAVAGSTAIGLRVTGDSIPRLLLEAAGVIKFSTGSGSNDLVVKRLSDGVIQISNGAENDGGITIKGQADKLTHANTTHKRSYWAATCSINPYTSGNQLAFDSYYVCPATNNGVNDYGLIPLTDIPDGSTLTKLTIIGATDTLNPGTGVAGAQLLKRDHSNGSNIVAAVEISAAATSDSDTCSDVVDHGSYGYMVELWAYVDSGGDAFEDAKIYKIEVEFTTTNLKQR